MNLFRLDGGWGERPRSWGWSKIILINDELQVPVDMPSSFFFLNEEDGWPSRA
jgi:hypothetical protein